MLGLVFSLISHPSPRTETVKLLAEQSVWVYSHAGSPSTDEYLRIWGVDGQSVPANRGEIDDFSFGYLKFNLEGTKIGKATKATLILHTFAPASFSLEQSKQFPLEARPLIGEFDGPTWTFALGETITPGSGKDVFGTGRVNGDFEAEKPMEIDIDLLKGSLSFADAMAKAMNDPKHRLYLALTSALAPSSNGSGTAAGIYKVFSAATKVPGMVPEIDLEY